MTTNNHPAHGPVSLDRLHQIREILSKASAQSDGGNIGYAMADAVKVIDSAIAAFGAEPVGEVVLGEYDDCGRHPDARVVCIAADGQADWENFKDGTLLYSVTPAPLSIDERAAFNAWNNEDNLPIAGVGAKNAAWLAWQARAKLGSPPAPVVPDDLLSMAASAIEDLLEHTDPSTSYYSGVWADVPGKLRAAMLQSGNSPVTPDCWIPVSERMPYVGKKLALHGRRAKEDCAHYVDEGYLGSNGFFYFFDWEGGPRIDDCHNDDKATVTHWMYWELPAAPQQEVK